MGVRRALRLLVNWGLPGDGWELEGGWMNIFGFEGTGLGGWMSGGCWFTRGWSWVCMLGEGGKGLGGRMSGGGVVVVLFQWLKAFSLGEQRWQSGEPE